MKLKAAIYCRLSKEDVDKEDPRQESQSIVNQTMLLLDYVESHGFELYDIYKDDDYSGLYDDRPGFERLISDARDRKFDVVIAKTQSRFTRNMEHLEKYLHHDFPLWGIRFISVVDNVDTELKGNKKTRQINGLINEWYCEDLSESIKASYLIKQKMGQFLGPVAPYGYMKDPQDNHHLVPDPYASEVVKRIYHLYLSGIGKAKIGVILTDEGVLVPTEYKQKVQKLNYRNAHIKEGQMPRWCFQTIDGILRDEVYIGNTVQNKCSKKSYKDKKKTAVPKDQWIRVENTHEPIIDKETFFRVQEQMKQRTLPVDIKSLKENLFTGRMFCGDCGKKMISTVSKKNKNGERYRFYICSDYKSFGNRFCSSHMIKEEELKTIVLQDLKAQADLILSEKRKGILRNYKCISGTQTKAFNLKNLKEELKKIQNYKEKSFENYVDGMISKADYVKLKEKYDGRERQLQKEIQSCTGERIESSWETEFEDWLEKFTDDFNVEDLTREMVLNLIDSIYIYKDKVIEINYKFSLDGEPGGYRMG